VLVQVTLSDLKRWDARAVFFRQISVMTLIPFDLEQHVREGHIGHKSGVPSVWGTPLGRDMVGRGRGWLPINKLLSHMRSL